MTDIIMFDAINLAEIPLGPQAAAGYVDGRWATYPELAARYPNAHLLSIAVTSGADAECLDVETGDAVPADIPGWYERQRARGVERPCIYANASTMESSVVPLVKSGTLPRAAVRLWSAHYAGQHICGPASCGAVSIDTDGSQWTPEAWGRDLDESLLLGDFFGTPKPAAAKKEAVKVPTVPIDLDNGSILVHAVVNGQPVVLLVDTGDAIGPTFTGEDAQRLGLQQGAPLGVEGAGGASTAYETTATVVLDTLTYPDEPSAIDLDLQGQSLLGLPWFAGKVASFSFDLVTRQLSIVPKA